MKKILVVLCLFNFCLLNANAGEVSFEDERFYIYLSSRLTEESKLWNDEITKELEPEFDLFRPQDIDLRNTAPDEIDLVVYREDLWELRRTDLLLVLPPYGRDCAWEIGSFFGGGKPTFAYIESATEWLRDSMVKGGLTGIITNSEESYNLLLKDPATMDKSYLIPSRHDLAKILKELYREFQQREFLLQLQFQQVAGFYQMGPREDWGRDDIAFVNGNLSDFEYVYQSDLDDGSQFLRYHTGLRGSGVRDDEAFIDASDLPVPYVTDSTRYPLRNNNVRDDDSGYQNSIGNVSQSGFDDGSQQNYLRRGYLRDDDAFVDGDLENFGTTNDFDDF